MTLERIACVAEAAAQRARRGLVAGGALTVLLVTAFGFATAALYLALAGEAGAIVACLAVAGLYLLVALVFWLAVRRSGPPPPERRPPPERPGLEPDAIGHLVATFVAGVRAGREGAGRNGSGRDGR